MKPRRLVVPLIVLLAVCLPTTALYLRAQANSPYADTTLLKRGIVGTWHKLSAKHLPAYLDEMCFRFKNRKNDFRVRDTMLKLIGSPNLEYKQLTARVQDAA